MKKITRISFLVPFTLLISVGCSSISKAYISADQTTYEAIVPEYIEYVNKDTTLDQWEKDLRYLTVESWGSRIYESGKEINGSTEVIK